MAATLDDVIDEIARDPGRRADVRGGARAAALADDRPAHPEGLDRPEGGRRQADRRHLPLAPGAADRLRRASRAPRAARRLDAQLPAEELFDGEAAAFAGARGARPEGRAPHERQPARQRRPAAARPHAARLPRLRRRRPEARAGARRGDARPRHLPARRRSRQNPDNFRIFGPDETASNRLGAVFEATDRAWEAERSARRRPPRARRPRDGGAERAPLPGLARGLPAHRPPRALLLLRGVHPHRRLDVQPARQVAEGQPRHIPGGGRSPRSTTCSPRTSGGRTTTASPTRTRASSTTSSTRRPRSSASTCRPTPTRCCRSPTTACAAATTST